MENKAERGIKEKLSKAEIKITEITSRTWNKWNKRKNQAKRKITETTRRTWNKPS